MDSQSVDTNMSASKQISVVIAEDQAMVRGALAALLELESGIMVLAQVGDGIAALQAVEQHQPDILLTDIEMPGMTGLELAASVYAAHNMTKVIILSTFARSGYLRRALDAGVRGYLLKDAPASQLAEAIRSVHSGGRAIAPELATEAWSESDPLSDRERQILRLAADGRSTSDIAVTLHLAEGTVRNYLSEAISKLGAANRIDAARIARQKGFL